ncbi:hypothetical protein BC829DRAFT_141842 [Chytridium lagenaria]|nr:hypothetical protein BC829DRAFT_141842 [Chytridium lagenaria]
MAPPPDLGCQNGLICCESLNRCDYREQCSNAVFPNPGITTTSQSLGLFPTDVPAPTCVGSTTGNIVCKTSRTFNFCINGALLNTPDQTCPPGTVCCASSNSCDFQFNCQSVRPPTTLPPVNVVPTTTGFVGPVPTIPPATCPGRGNGNIICTSSSTFNICLNGEKAGPNDQQCPPGTVCCQATNACDFAANCPPVVIVPPTTSIAATNPIVIPTTTIVPPTVTTTLTPIPTEVFNRVCGTTVGFKCMTPTTFNFCENGRKFFNFLHSRYLFVKCMMIIIMDSKLLNRACHEC